jgi:hypothetical protein
MVVLYWIFVHFENVLQKKSLKFRSTSHNSYFGNPQNQSSKAYGPQRRIWYQLGTFEIWYFLVNTLQVFYKLIC